MLSRLGRGLALLLCLTLSLAAAAARAQSTPSSPPPTVSADELQHLVGTLQDPSARQKLVGELQALIDAQRASAPQPAETGAASFITGLSQQVDAISGEILAAAGLVVDAPRIITWLEDQVGDQAARDRWLYIGLKLAVIFGCALLAEWVVRTLLRRPAAGLAARPGRGATARLFVLLLTAIVEGLPVLVFVGTASMVLPLTKPYFGTQQVASVLISALLWARLVLAGAHVALLSPSAIGLYPLGEETRNYLYIWARRFTNWAVYSYAVSSGAWWLGVPGAIYALLLRGTVLVLAILAIIFVLQNRSVVAEWLRGRPRGANAEGAATGGGWRIIRQRLADIWHVLAIIYITGTFGVFVLRIEGGFLFLVRATVLSVVVLLAAALIVRAIERLSQRGFAIGADLKTRFPTLELRANRYLPVLVFIATTVIYAFAALALLQAWGFSAFAWLSTEAGRRITGTLLTIAAVIAAGLLLWELFSSAVERYLMGSDGNPYARSARVRTLLPLVRTAMSVVIVIIVALIVLSELGVDIAPLLAGAGIVGIAVGFGSQALVKDVITGLFILIEDTLAVGDVVDVGKGSGVVETITIRTIRLRDMSGTVHTIPFSEVTTVRNMTRGYAYALIDVGVLYREDPDRVTAVLREVGAELAADPEWQRAILAPLEVIGLDRFTDSAVVLRVRLKTAPLKQWDVAREFNRRMKKAFDAHGIEMPSANQTHYLDPRENAPTPLRAQRS